MNPVDQSNFRIQWMFLFLALSLTDIHASTNQWMDVPKDGPVVEVNYAQAVACLKQLEANPAVKDFKMSFKEIEPGSLFYAGIPESEQGPTSGLFTQITAQKINEHQTRISIKTIKVGVIFNTRNRKLETERRAELMSLIHRQSSP